MINSINIKKINTKNDILLRLLHIYNKNAILNKGFIWTRVFKYVIVVRVNKR